MHRHVPYCLLLAALSLSLTLVQPALAQKATSSTLPRAATFPVSDDKVPDRWNGRVFEPNFAFPKTPPVGEPAPWKTFDYKTQPAEYMAAVMGYIFEGADKSTWRLQDNAVRKWFHVPWMHAGFIGREFISGLTRERNSLPRELGAAQTSCRQNWAVGFYNVTGALTLGEVWGQGTTIPNPAKARFRPGTVVAKLLYTEATEADFPALAGAPTTEANIHTGPDLDDFGCVKSATNPRRPATLRLMQMDVAIRDERADVTTGWIYGTFIYDGKRPTIDPWDRLVPVGLMWGNDPQLSDAAALAGAKPTQSIVLNTGGLDRAFGRSGRMNGPVDNPQSACLSCHATAQYPSSSGKMAPGSELLDWADAKCWFRNLPPARPFGMSPPEGLCGRLAPGTQSLDYSLQLAIGIRNYLIANPGISRAIGSRASKTAQRSPEDLRELIERPYSFRKNKSYPMDRN
jgi:hypothetical protein